MLIKQPAVELSKIGEVPGTDKVIECGFRIFWGDPTSTNKGQGY